MTPQDRISRLAQQIGDRLQNASQAPEDIQKGVQQVVRGAFDRLELVSREDFDILMDVLQRTRTRVEALERQVASLETAIENQASASPVPAPTASVEATESHSKTTAKPAAKKPKANTTTASKSVDDSSLKDDI